MSDVLIMVERAGKEYLFTVEALREARERAELLGLGAIAVPAQAPVAEALLTSRQLAELLGVGDTLLEQMAKDGRIPFVRIGKALRFQPGEVIAALKRGHADKGTATRVQVVEPAGTIRGRNRPATSLQPTGKGRT